MGDCGTFGLKSGLGVGPSSGLWFSLIQADGSVPPILTSGKHCLLLSRIIRKHRYLYACVGIEKHMSDFLVGNDFPLKLVHK